MKLFKTTLLMILLSAAVHAQTGKVLEHQVLKSKTLAKDVHYTIYLPPDYDLATRRYPVVYLLHGYTDDDRAWVQFGEVNRYADKAINDGEIPPMIIITPDAGVSWYVNNFDGASKFEDFFTQEFIPFIDATYKTKPSREYRGVSGLSMGGYGSLLFSLKHPDMFSACAALSSGVFTDEEFVAMPDSNYDNVFKNIFGKTGLKGKERLTDAWYQNSILSLMEKKPLDDIKKVRWYLDCGDDDFLYKGNSTLHIQLRDRGIPHEFRIRDGEHNWTYWRTGITDALKFIGESFRR
ncbi:MAG TPA: alpha/beta hydrolase family protein [Cyclobacteriaceae bacterium]|nr:alpha/beta hydrolase family protein [Cyclobacteriaceae bacterium]